VIPPEQPAAGSRMPLSVVVAAMLLVTTGLMMTGIQPILLGVLVQTGRLNEAGLGQVAMVEVLGLALGSSIGPGLMNSGNMRRNAAVVCIALALGNLAMCWADSPPAILAVRGICGALEGLALGAANLAIAHSRRPARLFGMSLAISNLPQGLATYLLPAFFLPRWGVNAGYLLTAVLALATAVAAIGFVDRVDIHKTAGRSRIAWSGLLVAAILGTLAFNMGIGSAWNYLEQLGSQVGLAPAAVGATLSTAIAFQVTASVVSALWSHKLPNRLTLVFACLIAAAALLLMAQGSAIIFVCGAVAFGVVWLGIQPFQVTEFVSLDPSRRVAVLLAPLAMIGLSLGPFVSSFAVSSRSVTGAFWTAAALLGLASALYAVVAIASRRGGLRLADETPPDLPLPDPSI